jgi:hypothetical protein
LTTTTLTQLSIPKVNGGAFGDTFLMEDGIYDHVSREALTKSGVKFMAKNKGKAVIRGAPIDLLGAEVAQDGFVLEYGSTEQTVVNLKGSKFQFTNNKCAFKNLTANRNDWLLVRDGNDGLIEGNEVFGKNGMGNMILVGPGTIVKNTKVLNNKLHDHIGGSGNGAETVRFGASQVAKEAFNVEFAGNEIYNCNTSDDELITIKSSYNDIHDNIFRNNRGSPCLRHGRFNKIRNNKFEGTGIRIYGKGHTIIGNNFKRNPNKQLLQIVVGNAKYAEEEQNTDASYTQVRDLLFQNNYIDLQDSTDLIGLCFGYGSYALKPINNKIIANTILGTKGILANTKDGASWSGNEVKDNILYPTVSAKVGDMPQSGYTIKDPNAVPPQPEPTPIPPPVTLTLEERIKRLEDKVFG